MRIDYGFNVKVGPGVYINSHFTGIDTCPITLGARTMLGPNVSIFSGTHPLDPALRNGTRGPETGSDIHIGEDCWLAGNVIVLPGVTIGKGATIGAGSVVTKVRSSSSILFPGRGSTGAMSTDTRLGRTCISSGRWEPSEGDSQDRDFDGWVRCLKLDEYSIIDLQQ